ncbi:MAG: cardiolipin synthase [Chlorobi bacterium]|nr:cardiolipin synthase [Chlorobiota bacterium]
MILAINWSIIWSHIAWIIFAVYLFTILFTVMIVILENRDPAKTISWGLFIITIPVFGILGYLLFGQNFRKQKIFSRKGLRDLARLQHLSISQIKDIDEKELIENPMIRKKRSIIRLLLLNSKALLTRVNRVTILQNGRETFDSILCGLEKAEDHIHMEFYRWESDQIGGKIRDLLIEKARKGVKIRLIYDDVGSWKIRRNYIGALRKEGVEILPFMPVRFPYFTSKVNYRNHRKIIVIDGKTGFLGGLNIADKYIYGFGKIKFWRDTHMKITGEAVQSLQTIFLVDWYFVSGQMVENRKRYFPDPGITDKTLVQVVASGPDSDWASIMQAYFYAIATAEKTIWLSTPYFSPNQSILTAMKTASMSGVDVRLILPAVSDSTVAYWNSFSYVRELLDAGVRIFLYKQGFYHAKLLMVDSIFASVGTANLDNRSFDLNFEVNALIYNESLTRQLEEQFLVDLKSCREIKPGSWKKRPAVQKVKESLARIIGPLY